VYRVNTIHDDLKAYIVKIEAIFDFEFNKISHTYRHACSNGHCLLIKKNKKNTHL